MKKTFPLVSLMATLMLAGCQTSTPATTETPVKPQPAPQQESQESTVKASLEIKAPSDTQQSITGREQFGSQVSPDGKWLLMGKHEERLTSEGLTVIDHQLIAKSLDGQGEKVLFSMNEQGKYMAGEMIEVLGKRLTSEWTPAGWNKDGTKVYYAVTPKTEGYGGWYPNSNINFEKIMEVDIATQTDKEVFNPKAGFILSGVADFDGITQKALSLDKEEKGTVSITDLKTGKSQEVFASTKTMEAVDGIGYALLDPTGTKVAVVTYINPKDAAATDGPSFRDYELFIVDLATMNAKAVPQKDAGEFTLLNWVNPTSVKIHKYSPVGENDIEVSVD